jgi:hypothetical protein
MSNRKRWTTKDGTKIRIKDMTDEHLLNTIRFLDRKAQEIKDNTCPPNFSGEMAQMCAEQAYDQLIEAETEDLFPIYIDLAEEANRRKLEVITI